MLNDEVLVSGTTKIVGVRLVLRPGHAACQEMA